MGCAGFGFVFLVVRVLVKVFCILSFCGGSVVFFLYFCVFICLFVDNFGSYVRDEFDGEFVDYFFGNYGFGFRFREGVFNFMEGE